MTIPPFAPRAQAVRLSRPLARSPAAVAATRRVSAATASRAASTAVSSPELPKHKLRGASGAAPQNDRPLPRLPNELLLLVFEFCSTRDLVAARLTASRLMRLANVVLAHRLSGPAAMLALTTRTLATSHRSVVAVKRPLLTHYRQFLASSSSTEITEATWYTTPPAELHTVCECLCILRGAIPPPPAGVPEAGDGRVPTPWPTLKRIMSRYDFKSWLASMSTSVASIDIVNARRVENIIRMDATITYERLRDVSMAGYRLLIIVAAALQSVTLLDEIATSKAELTAFEAKYDRARKFLFAVGGLHLLPPPATVDR